MFTMQLVNAEYIKKLLKIHVLGVFKYFNESHKKVIANLDIPKDSKLKSGEIIDVDNSLKYNTPRTISNNNVLFNSGSTVGGGLGNEGKFIKDLENVINSINICTFSYDSNEPYKVILNNTNSANLGTEPQKFIEIAVNGFCDTYAGNTVNSGSSSKMEQNTGLLCAKSPYNIAVF